LRLGKDAQAVRWAGIDAQGRISALRDSYPDSPPGLIEITGAMAAVGAGFGGRVPETLVVEHDARGPRAIRSDRHTAWERVDEPRGADKRLRGLHRRARRGLRAEGRFGPGRQPG
jgi:hypothetical protein